MTFYAQTFITSFDCSCVRSFVCNFLSYIYNAFGHLITNSLVHTLFIHCSSFICLIVSLLIDVFGTERNGLWFELNI